MNVKFYTDKKHFLWKTKSKLKNIFSYNKKFITFYICLSVQISATCRSSSPQVAC